MDYIKLLEYAEFKEEGRGRLAGALAEVDQCFLSRPEIELGIVQASECWRPAGHQHAEIDQTQTAGKVQGQL